MTDDVKVWLAGGRVSIGSPYHLKETMASLPGARWDRDQIAWTIPASPSGIAGLREVLRPLDVRILATRPIRSLLARYEEGLAARSKGALPQPPVRKTNGWRHQLEAYHFVMPNPGALLGMEMGTGKSWVALAVMQNDPQIRYSLIAAPMSVVGNVWPGQFERHSAAFIRPIPLDKGSIARRTERARLAVMAPGPVCLIVNYEAMWRDPLGKWLLNNPPDFLVWDESHRIKSPGGRASRFAQRLSRLAARRLALTGTPLAHSPLDAYGQFRALDEAVFGTSFAKFRSKYAIMGGYGAHQVVGYQNVEEFRERYRSITYEVGAEVLDLPEALDVERYCTLGREGQKVYNDLEDKFYAEVEAGQITPANALVKLLRLRQVTGGFVRTDDDEDIEVDRAKRSLLGEVLSEIPEGEAVVVFCQFRQDLATVHEEAARLGRGSLELSGPRKELAEWNKPGAPPILAVQVQSGGVGVDLTRARYCIYYSIGFSLSDYLQSRRRVHRPGQERPVTYIHLLVERSVDVRVYRALERRQEVIDSILSGDRNEDSGSDNEAAAD